MTEGSQSLDDARHSTQYLQSFISRIASPAALVDDDGRCVAANADMTDWLGSPSSSLTSLFLTLPLASVSSPDARTLDRKVLRERLPDERVESVSAPGGLVSMLVGRTPFIDPYTGQCYLLKTFRSPDGLNPTPFLAGRTPQKAPPSQNSSVQCREPQPLLRPVGRLRLDANGRITSVSPEAVSLFTTIAAHKCSSAACADVLGKRFEELASGPGSTKISHRTVGEVKGVLLPEYGGGYPAAFFITPAPDGSADISLSLQDDPGEEKSRETLLKKELAENIAARKRAAAKATEASEARRRLRRKLSRLESRFAEAERLAGFGSWEYTPGSGLFVISRSLIALTNHSLPADALSREEMLRLIHPADRDSFLRMIAEATAEGEGSPTEFRLLNGSGEYRLMSGRSRAVRPSDGGVTRVSGIARDITAERHSSRLRKMEHQLEVAVAGGLDTSRALSLCLGSLLNLEEPEAAVLTWTDWSGDRHSVQTGQCGSPLCRREMEIEGGEKTVGTLTLLSSRVDGFSVETEKAAYKVSAFTTAILARDESDLRLRETEYRYRTVFENSPSGIALLMPSLKNGTLRVIECNESFTAITGRSREQLFEEPDIRRFWECEYPRQTPSDRLAQVMNGQTLSGHLSWKRPDGRENHVEYLAIPIRTDNETLICSIHTDRTGQHLLEEKLRASEAMFRELAENIRDQLFMRDLRTGAFLYVSPATRDIIGEDLMRIGLKKALLSRIPPEHRCGVAAAFNRQLKSGNMDAVFPLDRDGGRRWLRIRSFPVHDNEGTPYRVAGLIQDITSQYRYEESLKSISAKVITAAEDERRRIGQSLHDTTLQGLAGIRLMLESAAEGLADAAGEDPAAPFRALVPLLQESLGFVRDAVMDLRPTILDELGLVPALEWLCRETERKNPAICADHEIETGGAAFSDLQATVFFRIAQEAVANAAKYSHGDRISLRLHSFKGKGVLEIEDNGRGLPLPGNAPPDDEDSPSGPGIVGMRERAQLLGGSFTIGPGPDGGTLVRAVIPLGDS